MPHDYKNYAHIEGVVDNEPVVISEPQGATVRFSVAVRAKARDAKGASLFITQSFPVEVKDASRFVCGIKKGTPVIIDASIRPRTVALDGIEYCVMTLRAHRVHSVDFNGWKKEQVGELEKSLPD